MCRTYHDRLGKVTPRNDWLGVKFPLLCEGNNPQKVSSGEDDPEKAMTSLVIGHRT